MTTTITHYSAEGYTASQELVDAMKMFVYTTTDYMAIGIQRVVEIADRDKIPRYLVGDWIREMYTMKGLADSTIRAKMPLEFKRKYEKKKELEETSESLKPSDISHKNQPEQEEVKIKDNTTADLTENKEKEKKTEYNLSEITRPFTGSPPQPQTIDNASVGSVSEHKGLIDQVNELTKQNNELSAENQNLKSIVTEKNKTIDRLNDTLQKLETQIQYLKDQNKNMEKVDVNVVRADKPSQPKPQIEPKQQQEVKQQTTESEEDNGEFDLVKEKSRLEKLLEVKETEFLAYKGAKVGRIALSSDIRDLKDRILMLSRKK